MDPAGHTLALPDVTDELATSKDKPLTNDSGAIRSGPVRSSLLISKRLCRFGAASGPGVFSRQLRKAGTFRSSATGTYEQGARDSGSEACAGGCAVPGGHPRPWRCRATDASAPNAPTSQTNVCVTRSERCADIPKQQQRALTSQGDRRGPVPISPCRQDQRR